MLMLMLFLICSARAGQGSSIAVGHMIQQMQDDDDEKAPSTPVSIQNHSIASDQQTSPSSITSTSRAGAVAPLDYDSDFLDADAPDEVSETISAPLSPSLIERFDMHEMAAEYEEYKQRTIRENELEFWQQRHYLMGEDSNVTIPQFTLPRPYVEPCRIEFQILSEERPDANQMPRRPVVHRPRISRTVTIYDLHAASQINRILDTTCFSEENKQ